MLFRAEVIRCTGLADRRDQSPDLLVAHVSVSAISFSRDRKQILKGSLQTGLDAIPSIIMDVISATIQ